ncbi:MAG: putative sugar nucleotidyl transferase, partial [Salegentibacter sp.]
MNYILFDGSARDRLLPFTFTRPVADIRVGILTIREKWERILDSTTSTVTEDYLAEKYPMVELEENIMINASFLPTAELVEQVQNLQPNQAVFFEEEVVAFHVYEEQEPDFDQYEQLELQGQPVQISHTWEIFSKNGEAIEADFDLLTEGETSQPIPESNHAVNTDRI